MNNIEKGRLLTGLFPERLPEILRAVQQGYENLNQNEQSLRPLWDSSLHSFDYWYVLAAHAAETAAQYRNGKEGTHAVCEKLFSGCTAYYVIDCLIKQAEALPEIPENRAYKLALRLFFDCTAH